MIWNDTHLTDGFCPPKAILYLGLGSYALMTYLSLVFMIEKVKLTDKIISGIGAVGFTYFCIANIFLILKGSSFIKSIKLQNDQYSLTNIFNKQSTVAFSEIDSVKSSKGSMADRFITGFRPVGKGIKLLLKDGREYCITSDMENIDSLKEHFLDNKK